MRTAGGIGIAQPENPVSGACGPVGLQGFRVPPPLHPRAARLGARRKPAPAWLVRKNQAPSGYIKADPSLARFHDDAVRCGSGGRHRQPRRHHGRPPEDLRSSSPRRTSFVFGSVVLTLAASGRLRWRPRLRAAQPRAARCEAFFFQFSFYDSRVALSVPDRLDKS